MGSEDGLVEIHPRELQFLFIMQAERTAPPDLQIKDKFLVQTTVVPFGTSDEGIVPAFFSKESGRYIEENKLIVVLVSATQPEVEQPINGVPNAKTAVEVPVAKETLNIANEVSNVVNELPHPLKASIPPLRETPAILSKLALPEKETPTVLRDFPIPSKEAPATSTESALHLKETPTVSVDSNFSSTETSVALKESPPPLKDTISPKEVAILSDGVINAEYLHLSHAENLIIKLREESRTTIKERDKLRHEMVFLKRKDNSQSQAGFPLLFVIYIAGLGVSLGYLLHL